MGGEEKMSANFVDPGAAPNSKYFACFQKDALRFVNDSVALKSLLTEVAEKALDFHETTGKLKEMFHGVQEILSMTQKYVFGEYKEFSHQSMVLMVTALLYFMNPFDLIFDYIPVFGYLDDAAIVSFVLNSIDAERQKFQEWKQNKSVVG